MSAQCLDQAVSAGTPISFVTFGVSFGSGVGFGGNSIVLQPGFYNVHLSAERLSLTSGGSIPLVQILVTGGSAGFTPLGWLVNTPDNLTGAIEGDKLVHVTAANTTIQFSPSTSIQINNSCRLVIMQIQ